VNHSPIYIDVRVNNKCTAVSQGRILCHVNVSTPSSSSVTGGDIYSHACRVLTNIQNVHRYIYVYVPNMYIIYIILPHVGLCRISS
jgi:hypothetical protein